MGKYDPIGYTYEAGVHCPDCALERFGSDEHGFITGIDSEGNDVGAIPPWGDCPDEGEYCGDCGREITPPREV
jgi:hypothetical protein